MSVINCQHCENHYDSDFHDYCPRCIETSGEFNDNVHMELTHGDECCYCGREIQDPLVLAEKEEVPRE